MDAPVKRSGTPKPKKAVGRKTMPESLEEEQDDNFLPSRATPPKKARGRPRKNVESVLDIARFREPGASLHTPNMDVITEDAAVRKTTRRQSRARRMEITPMKIAVDPDVESPDSPAKTDGSTSEAAGPTVDNSIGGTKLRQDDLQETQLGVSSAIGDSSPGNPLQEEQDEDMWRAMVRRQSQSRSNGDELQQDQAGLDPTTEHQEYDTILESEGFSMVSVSSLASNGDRNASSAEQGDDLSNREQASDLTEPPSEPPPAQSKQAPSEHNERLRSREQTPVIGCPPLVPPALQDAPQQSPRPLEKVTGGTPKLARVIRAGIALQGVLIPTEQKKLGSPFRLSEKSSPFLSVEDAANQHKHSSPMSKAKSPKDRLDDLFSGFGAGTKRELKAGLRLGEELAKRQRQILQEPETVTKTEDDVFASDTVPEYPSMISSNGTTDYILNAPGSSEAVHYPLITNNQLPSPEISVEDPDEDHMSWKAESPMKPEYPTMAKVQGKELGAASIDEAKGPAPSKVQPLVPETSDIDQTMLAREAEWQLEREAVSQQIEMASKSQVILIDCDNDDKRPGEDDREDGSDIWQAEASQSREPTPETSEILLQPEVVKSRRSKLPSLWMHNSQVVYSDEVEPTEADLFWQPDKSKRKALKQGGNTPVESQAPKDDSRGTLLDRQLDPITVKTETMALHGASKSSVLVVPRTWDNGLEENQRIDHQPLSLPVTPEQTQSEGYSEVFSEDVTLTPIGDRTIDALPVPHQTPVCNKTVDDFTSLHETATATIDPLLLQKPIQKPTKKQQKKKTQAQGQRSGTAIVPLNAADTQSSWISRLTAPIWRAFTSLPPPATKEDILCSGPYEPLCQFTPWEACHFRALQPLYYASLLYGSHIFPYNRYSITAAYLGMKVVTDGGWSRRVTEADCGVADAFMILLEERGFALAEQPGERWIDEGLVVMQCVALWVQMVMRGEVEIDRSKGETVGLRMEGDRLWTKEDIDWKNNQSEYFERKKREFDGLPSWKEKGIQWR